MATRLSGSITSAPEGTGDATSLDENRGTAADKERGRMELETPDFDVFERNVETDGSHSVLLRREPSILLHRDRAKSLDGGVIHQPLSRPSRSSVAPRLASIWNRVAYGIVLACMRKARKSCQQWESKRWSTFTEAVRKVVSSIFFKFFMMLLVLSHAILLCLYQPEVQYDIQPFNEKVFYVTIGILLVYVVEALLNIIAYGLSINPRIYLLDLFIIMFGVLFLSLRKKEPVIAEFFASLMALKVLKILALFNRVRFMLKVLAKSLKPLFHLGSLTFIVTLFFAILGIQLFKGQLHGGCYANYTIPSGLNKSILISRFPCSLGSSPVGGRSCPHNSVCMRWSTGPHQGFASFDNIFLGILVVFQCITLEGWSAIYYLYASSLGVEYTWLYFVVVILLGSILILNLFVGVLTNVFIGVSDREEHKGNIRRNKAKKQIESDLNNYNEWMKKGAELLQPNDVTGSIERFPVWTPPNAGSSSEEEDEEDDANNKLQLDVKKHRRCECYYHSSSKLSLVVCSKVWFYVNLGAHAINIIFLMTIHFPTSYAYENAMHILNHIFSGLFVVDIILKIYARGPIQFFKKKKAYQSFFSIGEVFLALVSVVGLLSDFKTDFHLLVLVNAVWSLKLVLVGKISRKTYKHLKELLETLGQLIASIASVLCIICVFLYIYTIVGLRLFGNRLSITSGIQQPNFDSYWNSMLLVFQLLTSEDWHNILHQTSSALTVENSHIQGYASTLYFLIGIIVGSIVLFTVVLALLVDKLSEVRASEEDQEKHMEELQKERKLRSEQISALRGPEKNVQRRTIRQLIRFQAHNPVERSHTVKQDESKNYWRQSSLPQFSHKLMRNFSFTNLELGRAASIPATPMKQDDTKNKKLHIIKEESDMTNSETSHGRHASLGRMEGYRYSVAEAAIRPAPSRKANPLRLVKEPSSFIDEQKLRMGGKKIGHPTFTNSDHSFLSTAISKRLGRMKHKKPADEESTKPSKEKGANNQPSESEASNKTDRIPSKYSSPGRDLNPIEEETVTDEGKSDEISTDKPDIQSPVPSSPSTLQCSSPLDAQRNSAELASSFDNKRKLSQQLSLGIGEIECEEKDKMASDGSVDLRQHISPTILSPSNASLRGSLDVEPLACQYTRGSSLEPIHPWRQLQTSSDGRPKKSTRQTIKDKASKAWEWMKNYFGSFQLDPRQELAKIPPHSSFLIFDHESSFRHFCFSLVRSRSFQAITYTVIALSSVMLMLEIPVGARESQILCSIQSNIIWLDVVFISFFIIEMVLKMVSLGVFLHRDSYLRGVFNIVDFIIIILNLIPIVYFLSLNLDTRCLSYGYATDSAIGILRVSRVFRPVRALRIGGLRLAVTGIFSSTKATLSILFINVLFITIFAVIGINFFKGSFFSCTDPSIRTEDLCLGTYFKYDYSIIESNVTIPGLSCPVAEPRNWTNQDLNFDNFARAFLTLFAMITAEGWEHVMYSGINSQRISEYSNQGQLGSIPENSPQAALYFILYMIIMTFIFLQLFVGFVIVTFQEIGVTSFKETRLNRNQRHCLHFALTTKPNRQWIPRYEFQRRYRKKLLPIIKSYQAKILIFVALILNILTLSMEHDSPPSLYFDIVLDSINAFFTAFFLIEVLVRIIVITPPIFFRSIWNTFEALIALGSTIELIVILILHNGTLSHKISAFRVLRLLRFYPAVRRILWTVINSLEVFPWVGYLLVIVVFIYSVLGMNLFGNIERVSIDEAYQLDRGIHEYNNFATFPGALLVMIRVITGENWPDVMLSSVNGQHHCEPSLSSNNSTGGCGSFLAYFFYPSFYFISTIIILSLFVAIIIDNFDYVIRDKSILGAYELKQFVTQWFKIDKETRGTLTPNEVFGLFRKLNPPVGWGKLCPQIVAYKKMMRLNIPIVYEQEAVEGSTEVRIVKKVTFNATLFALVKNVLKIGCTGCPDCSRKCNKDLRERLVKCFPTMEQKLIDNVLAKEEDETVASEYAVLMVQSEWRAFMQRRRRLIETFHGSEGGPLKVYRNIPDPGPDLSKQRRISHFVHDLEDHYPIVPRKVSDASSIFSDRSLSSLSPIGRKRSLSSCTMSREGLEDKHNKESSPSVVTPPAVPYHHRPLSPNLEVSGDLQHLPLNLQSQEAERNFLFDHLPSDCAKSPSVIDEETYFGVDSPVFGRKSEADTVSFASAYSQPHQSTESLELHETTV